MHIPEQRAQKEVGNGGGRHIRGSCKGKEGAARLDLACGCHGLGTSPSTLEPTGQAGSNQVRNHLVAFKFVNRPTESLSNTSHMAWQLL